MSDEFDMAASEDDESEFKQLYELKMDTMELGETDAEPATDTDAESDESDEIFYVGPNAEKFIMNSERFFYNWPIGNLFTSLESIVNQPELLATKKPIQVTVSDQFDCGLLTSRSAFWHLKSHLTLDENGEKYIGVDVCLDRMAWTDYPFLEATSTVYMNLQLIDDQLKFIVGEGSGPLTFGLSKHYDRKFSFEKFIKYEDLLSFKPRLGNRGHFYVIFDIFGKCPMNFNLLEACSKKNKNNNTNNKVYAEMWRAKTPDVKIEVGGKTLLANKGLLEARSSVFARILEESISTAMDQDDHDRAHEISGNILTLKIDDFEADIMEVVLEYMYTDQIDIGQNFDKAKEMFRAAEKYHICFLKNDIFQYLPSILTMENILQVLEFAEVNEAPERVCERIIEFCEANETKFGRKTSGRSP